MKIRKVEPSVGILGKILNIFSNSKKDTYSCDYINGLAGKILWTNPNPESEFTSQNITLSSDDYDELIWYFISDIDNVTPVIISSTNFKKYGTQAFFSSNASLRYWARRIIYNSNTTYRIENCHLIDSTGMNNSNNSLVPLCVVGKKTGLFN